MPATQQSAQFVFFNIGIHFSADDPAMVAAFRSMYRNFRTGSMPEKHITCYIQSGHAHAQPALLINDSVRYPLPAGGGCLGYAEMLLFRHIFEQLDAYILFHAGVVEKNSRGYIILAPSGFGKTTLVLELVARGYRFLSDEFCPITTNDAVITPFPRRLGLARSSPFFSKVPLDKAEYLEFERKYGIDCNDMFPGSAGSVCRPGCIIQLSADLDRWSSRPSCHYVDLTLFEDCRAIVERLAALSHVSIVRSLSSDPYPGFRLRIDNGSRGQEEFQALWQKFDDRIFGVSVVPEQRPDFSASPALQEVPASAAVFDIASQVVNRLPTGKLMARYNGRVFPLVADVARVMAGARCFTLRPGNVSRMADLIDTLH
jgi:hypothetical protein